MRETKLANPDGGSVTVATDDRGTDVLDAAGAVVCTYGTDRHAEVVARHRDNGWQVTTEGDVRPATLAGTPPPDTDEGGEDPRTFVQDGEAG